MRNLGKGLIGTNQTRRLARLGLEAPADHVAVERVEFDETGHTARALGRDQRGAGAAEAIQNDVTAAGYIADRIRDWPAP